MIYVHFNALIEHETGVLFVVPTIYIEVGFDMCIQQVK